MHPEDASGLALVLVEFRLLYLELDTEAALKAVLGHLKNEVDATLSGPLPSAALALNV